MDWIDYFNLKVVCSVLDKCGDSECINYNAGYCKIDGIEHSTDGVCISGRRKVEGEYKRMINDYSPIDYRLCERDR